MLDLPPLPSPDLFYRVGRVKRSVFGAKFASMTVEIRRTTGLGSRRVSYYRTFPSSHASGDEAVNFAARQALKELRETSTQTARRVNDEAATRQGDFYVRS